MLWNQWWNLVCELRPACARNRTFLWMALCLAGSFLFSGMEAGVFALSRLRIRQLMRTGSTRAQLLPGGNL